MIVRILDCIRWVVLIASTVAPASLILIESARASVHVEWLCPKEKPRELCLEDGNLAHIYIYGDISQETADHIAQLDGMMPARINFPKIYVNSYGGDVIAARQIARILRRRNATIESKDVFFPNNHAVCFSACLRIAAGGVVRRIAHIGIHQSAIKVYQDNRVLKRTPHSELDKRTSYEFWKEMGISPEIIAIETATPFEDMAEFIIDPTLKPEDQVIVRLGFWMGPIELKNDTRTAGETSSFDQLVAAWERGDASVAYKIGTRFLNGTHGFSRNAQDAVVWLERAGKGGIALAWHSLGVLAGSKRNPGGLNVVAAAKYYRLAAEAGFAGAQNNLGWAFYKGEGVQKNYAEAIYWLTRAAEQGEPFAYGSLALLWQILDRSKIFGIPSIRIA